MSASSPQGQDRHSVADSSNSSHGGAVLDRRMCESPHQSMSEEEHSDYSTLAEKEEGNDVVRDNPARMSPRRPPPIRVNQNGRQRQDTWRSNQFSPTGTVFDSRTFYRDLHIPHTDSPTDEKSSVAQPIRAIAAPAHYTHPQTHDIYPCFPTQRSRYERKIVIPKNEKFWEFEPLETFTVHDVYCDGRWTPNIHPEGQLYFASERRNGQFRYLTEENLYEQTNVDQIERFVEEFEKKADHFGNSLSMDVEVFVSFWEYEERGWYYYCVDTERRCLFWIDKVDLTWMAEAVGTVPSKAHLKYGLDYEYWTHVEHFPFHQIIPESLIHDLMGVAIHQSVDSISSLDSTTPFSKEETQELVGLIKHLHTLTKTEFARGYIVVAAARLMTLFVNERFFHFAGQHGAKLTKHQSIRGNKWKRTFLIRLISPTLFYAPETHLSSLEKIYVDETIKSHPWKTFVSRLEEDWKQYVLYSTVLLTADVSLLAVPNVMPNSGIPAGQGAPPAVVATQISLIAAMGSIVIGLLLVREHSKKSADSSEAVADFLRRRSHPSRGLETMAILYSLPFALLMWGMVSFLAALGAICFVFAVNGLVPSILYAIVWGFVSLMILSTILTQSEARLDVSWQRFKLIKWLPWSRRRPEEGEEDPEADRRSVSSITAGSVRSRRTRTLARMPLDFFMRRKKNSRRDTPFDLERGQSV